MLMFVLGLLTVVRVCLGNRVIVSDKRSLNDAASVAAQRQTTRKPSDRLVAA